MEKMNQKKNSDLDVELKQYIQQDGGNVNKRKEKILKGHKLKQILTVCSHEAP